MNIIQFRRAEAYLPIQIRQWGIAPLTDNELRMGWRVQAVLEQHYPGHPWVISPSDQAGCIFIRHPMLLHPRYGAKLAMVIHLSETYTDPALKVVVKRAGEFLERWGQPRSGLVLSEIKKSFMRVLDATGADMRPDVRREA